jgi:hypothetical protein
MSQESAGDAAETQYLGTTGQYHDAGTRLWKNSKNPTNGRDCVKNWIESMKDDDLMVSEAATQYRTESGSDRMLHSTNDITSILKLRLASGRYRSRFCIECQLSFDTVSAVGGIS